MWPVAWSLNKEINRKATRGLIVYGLIFEKDKLQFKPNYHISLSGPRGLIDDDSKYEIYTQSTKNCIINKFKNIKDLDYHDQIYEDIFNLCIDMIMKRVYGDRYEEVQKEYAKLNSEEKYDTPKDSEGKKDSAQKTEVSTGGRRNKNQSRVIGTRILMRRIKI